MCGIAGVVGTSPKADILDRLSDALAHRGPDGRGTYANGPCAMAHTRLAIIDLQTGDQPFVVHREDGGEVALIANGEIYNNSELRAKMVKTAFKTRSDCEVPLHLYLKHGLDFVDHLRGMYAIALWDADAAHLVLSRDSFGIKPLYYAETERGFVFASEAGALLRAGLLDARVDEDKRDELVQLQFTTGRTTILKGVYRVLPGETLVVKDAKIVERRVRRALPDAPPRRLTRAHALADLDQVMNDAVGIHQRSDVPYGMFLSGGVDSSVLLAMMHRLNTEPVMAFTAGFSATTVPDERAHARALAECVGAHHIEVEFDADDFWALLPRIAAHLDDPVADYAVLPTWKLAACAREHGLKVVLSGEGADELFAGYGRYRTAIRSWPFAREIYRKGILDSCGVLRRKIPARVWRKGISQAAVAVHRARYTRLQDVQALDIATGLADDLLIKTDRMLMAHGVEGRVPFLDDKLAHFAFGLPDNLKIKHGLGKHVLRHWLESAMPEAKAFSRKRGFTVPVGEWIAQRGAALGDALARQDSLLAICDPQGLQSLFRASPQMAGKAQWTLLFYAVWHKVWIEGANPEGGVFDVLR